MFWKRLKKQARNIIVLKKKLKIAVEALEKLSQPLVGEWHCNVAQKALEDMKNAS